MNYRLVVITHGDGEPLAATLDSFFDSVRPLPSDTVVVWDGPMRPVETDLADTVIWSETPQGFCRTARTTWTEAARLGVDYVFWLEHDFEFLRPVELELLARTLEYNSELAQMSLLREPMGHEGESLAVGWERFKAGRREWMEQSTYWTTNPSLIPGWVFRQFEWPDEPHCEGKHTIALREEGLAFGVWGDGEPWVRHTGVRTGFGY